MTETNAIELLRQTLYTILLVSGPAVIAAMIVGTVISFLQALTQVQEVTLSFVPKIITLFVVLLMSATFMGAHVFSFASMAFDRIEKGF